MKLGIAKLISTFFGIGYLPYMPGTYGSIAGVVLYYLLRNNIAICWFFVIIIILLGFLASKKAEDIFGKKDPSFVVIDEVAAIMVVLLFAPQTIFFIILSFLLFRLFDIIKPCPIKKIEQFSGSWGIMLDDLMAAAYAILVIYLVKYIFNYGGIKW